MAEQLERQRGHELEAQQELEAQVAERTAELAEANRRLTELDEQRVRFLADVSHELRTPLTVLRGEAEVALRGMSKPEAIYRESLQLIVNQAADMGRLVEDLLFLARSEAEEIRYEFRVLRMAMSLPTRSTMPPRSRGAGRYGFRPAARAGHAGPRRSEAHQAGGAQPARQRH